MKTKHARLIGIALITIGILIGLSYYNNRIAYYQERYAGFAHHGYWDSFEDYWEDIRGADTLLSVVFGCIPAFAGVVLLSKAATPPKETS